MNLLWKFLRAGYMENNGSYKEGGILSPMLSNLYLTPLDEFVDDLKQKYDKIEKSIVEDGVLLRTIPSAKIHYVRYADDWVIGVTGKHELALEIKNLIKEFLSDKLKLKLNSEKTKITNLGSEYA
jgi:retron-type reverse transcriptase